MTASAWKDIGGLPKRAVKELVKYSTEAKPQSRAISVGLCLPALTSRSASLRRNSAMVFWTVVPRAAPVRALPLDHDSNPPHAAKYIKNLNPCCKLYN